MRSRPEQPGDTNDGGDYFELSLDANGTVAVYTVLSSFADLYVAEPH